MCSVKFGKRVSMEQSLFSYRNYFNLNTSDIQMVTVEMVKRIKQVTMELNNLRMYCFQ